MNNHSCHQMLREGGWIKMINYPQEMGLKHTFVHHYHLYHIKIDK